MKKKFKKIDLSYKRIIVLAIFMGIITAILNLIPFLKDTSFSDIAVNLEVWIVIALFIILNTKKPAEAAVKCFLFFLISTPLVYLVESPFLGFQVFNYYPRWFVMTLLTLPGAYIVWFIKKENVISSIILGVVTSLLVLLGTNYLLGLATTFPRHLISCIFTLAAAGVLPFIIFKEKRYKIITSFITLLAFIASLIFLARPSDETVSFDYSFDPNTEWTCEIGDANFEIEVIDTSNIKLKYVYNENNSSNINSNAYLTCSSEDGNSENIKISYQNNEINAELSSYMAKDVLNTYSKRRLKLDKQISEYEVVYFEEESIEDADCYVYGVYEDLSTSKNEIATFAVSKDGEKVYKLSDGTYKEL